MDQITGRIIKGISGFYYVHDGTETVYECKARGVFRSIGVKPLPGDMVRMEILDRGRALGSILSILPRSSELVRPAAANVDQALLVFSVKDPQPSFNLIDRLLISYYQMSLPVTVAFSKSDLDDGALISEYTDIYRGSGVRMVFFSTHEDEGLEDVRSILRGRITVIAGPSGAGKSSLINRLAPGADMEVGEISPKLKRGRNTTRHTELFCVGKDSFILDTPGFTSFMLEGITENDLRFCYREFEEYGKDCRFADCVHIGETSCAVKKAVDRGLINRVRYENYRMIYADLKAARKY